MSLQVPAGVSVRGQKRWPSLDGLIHREKNFLSRAEGLAAAGLSE